MKNLIQEERIQSLPTFYGDTMFRSRLEARWAIFFDCCGIRWEYEPQLFHLKNGKKYLPDFLLHDLVGRFEGDLWAEVKGEFRGDDWEKVSGFMERVDDWNGSVPTRPLLILGDIFSYEKGKGTDKLFNDNSYFWRVCEASGGTVFFNHETLDGDYEWPAILGVNKDGKCEIFEPDGYRPYHNFCDREKTERAYDAARSATFYG